MKTPFWHLSMVAVLLFAAAGCKRGGPGGRDRAAEAPITGRASDPPIELRAHWSTTNRYLYHLELSSASQFPGSRRDGGDAESTLSAEFTLTPSETNADGSRSLTMEFTSVDLDLMFGDRVITTGGESIGDERSRATAGAVRRLVGGKVIFRVAADNSVLRILGVDSLFTRIDQDPGNPTTNKAVAAARRRMSADTPMLRRIINETALRQVVEASQVPNKTVAIGESWKVRRDVAAGMAGAVPITVNCTLRGWQKLEDRNCARIDLSGAVATAKDTAEVEDSQRRRIRNFSGPRNSSMNAESGKFEGRAWFDPELGVMTAYESQAELMFKASMMGFGRMRGPTNAPASDGKIPFTQQLKLNLIALQPK